MEVQVNLVQVHKSGRADLAKALLNKASNEHHASFLAVRREDSARAKQSNTVGGTHKTCIAYRHSVNDGLKYIG